MSFALLPTKFAVADCGHGYCGPSNGGASGYAIIRNAGWYGDHNDLRLLWPDAKICYPCADDGHRAEIDVEDITGGYLSSDGKSVTTWTGGWLMNVTWYASDIAYTPSGGYYHATYIRAVDRNGHEWYGRNGGKGMCITMRLTAASKRKRDA